MSKMRELFSADPQAGLRRSTVISNTLFVAGLALTAVIMTWDRVPAVVSHAPYLALTDSRGLAPQELLAVLLLLQRGLVQAWDRFRHREGAWPNLGLAAAFGLPVVAAGLATLTAYNFGVAVTSSLIFCFALGRGWVLAQYIRERELRLFENILLGVTVVGVVFGYYQFLGDIFGLPESWTQLMPSYSSDGTYPFPRVQSFALEPLYLGHSMFLPLGILLTRYWRNKRAPLFEQILLVFALGLFLLTLSRGAMLGLALAVLALIVVGRAWRPLLYLARSGTLAVVIVVAMLALAGHMKTVNTPETVGSPDSTNSAGAPSSSPSSGPDSAGSPDESKSSGKSGALGAFTEHATNMNDDSAQTRYELWPSAWRLFLKHPLIGVGPNNSRVLLHDGSATLPTAEANKLQPVNNDYLAYITEFGLLGVLLALPLLWLILRAMWSVARARLDHPSSPYAFAVVGMAFEANAFHSMLLLRTWVVLGLLIAGTRLVREQQARARVRAEGSDDLGQTVVLDPSVAETAILNLGSAGSKTA